MRELAMDALKNESPPHLLPATPGPRVFMIPAWHPLPHRPTWANWVLPHIDAAREAGADVRVLQADLDTLDAHNVSEDLVRLSERHLYAPVRKRKHRFHRTRFFFQAYLDAYSATLERLFLRARALWGTPDVLHAHVSLPAGYGAAQLGRRYGIPVVVTEHYSGFENDVKYWWRLRHFVRAVNEQVQGFYAVSPGFAERLRRTGLIDVSGVLPNPINLKKFNIDASMTRSAAGPLRIVSTGTLSHVKGTDTLLAAMTQLGTQIDWHLTLYGDHAQRHQYKRWLNQPTLAERVTLAGCVTQPELARGYNQADLYVVSSRVETANVSMLQALACGTPVITTRCHAPETLIDDTVGLTVPVADASALALAIARFARERRVDRSNNRRFVQQRYASDVVGAKMLQAYQQAMSKLPVHTHGR